jgi:hypothetical protein
MQLNNYLQATQRFLREAKQEFVNAADLIEYVNRARREVAQRTQCVRRLTPISGAVTSAEVTAGGSGYVAPVVTISAPDFPDGGPSYPNGAQALATASVAGGIITAVNITYGGAGYFEPVVTITDSTGTGATASLAVLPALNLLNAGQESYPFSDINVAVFPGIDSVFAIQSVAVIYANYRYALPLYDFSTYQAKIRQYPFQYQYVPAFASQYGQGNDGSFYAYPLPSQTYQWEFDCFCTPQDLLTNLSVDVIPQPWADVVPYFAAHLAYLELQNMNAANFYLDLFDKMCLRKSQYARVGRRVNPYGRY